METNQANSTRLKQLMKLQLATISQLQDILKKKESEISALKTISQNYKLQLERVRRRVSLNIKNDVIALEAAAESPPMKPATFSVGLNNDVISEDKKTESRTPIKNTNEDIPPEKQNDVVKILLEVMENKSSAPSDLISTLNKACTTDLKGGEPCQLCDQCANCTLVASSLFELLRLALRTDTSVIDKISQHQTEYKNLMDLIEVKMNIGSDETLMQTYKHFYRNCPAILEYHWWFQTNLNTDEKHDSLNTVPIWRKIEPKQNVTAKHDEEILESTEDDEYNKRHLKLEMNEKKRKRWDIQRIREFRYTEKLKQKTLKQDTPFIPTLDSFNGYLLDAESIQVADTLPINIFGHPLPYIEPEEFSLAPMKSQVPPKKKQRK